NAVFYETAALPLSYVGILSGSQVLRTPVVKIHFTRYFTRTWKIPTSFVSSIVSLPTPDFLVPYPKLHPSLHLHVFAVPTKGSKMFWYAFQFGAADED
ncbi:MAG: hypothetical protein QF595_05520, partial [Dehalococcoidia bacterium]|nr:hypothetical protein [Dehalococcoidia bacterium]